MTLKILNTKPVTMLARLAPVVVTVTMAFGQGTTPPPDVPPAAAPSGSKLALSNINFSGVLDGAYSFNFNHPASRVNNLRNFDVRANQFNLNMAKITLDRTAEPVGFRLDLGVGRAFEIFHAAEPKDGLNVMRNVMQAYASVKPAQLGGLQFDFGKFYTSAGAEVTETHLNWNYSRSLLYANGPYYHFGARVTKPITNWFSGGFQVVNGWNNVEDNNSGKTVGFTTAMTGKKVSWFNSYYVGPEKTATNEGRRHFWDTVVNLNPTSKASFYVNFDYGVDKVKGGVDNDFWGIAVAHRYAVNSWFALSPRVEYYSDNKGFITSAAQKLKEFTMTADFKMRQGFLMRCEYRTDWSDKPFFDRGNQTGNHRRQDTLLVGFVLSFGGEQ